jgi:carbon monoxide dehydrogenase subunit G
MDLIGEYKIPAPRAKVWEALNDPAILKQCIEGCEELNKDGENGFTAKVTAKVGPVKAKFAGKVTLENIDAPNGYTIRGEGQGGVAGFAKGAADVKLRDDGADTVLNYSARAEVGGKLASVGSRLVEGVAKKTADDFFGKFSRIVGAGGGVSAPAPQMQQGAPTQGSVLGDGPGEREQPVAVDPAQNVAEGAQVQQSAAAAPLGMASSASAAGPATHGTSASAAPVATPNATGGLSPWVWGVGLVVIVGVLWYAFGR